MEGFYEKIWGYVLYVAAAVSTGLWGLFIRKQRKLEKEIDDTKKTLSLHSVEIGILKTATESQDEKLDTIRETQQEILKILLNKRRK